MSFTHTIKMLFHIFCIRKNKIINILIQFNFTRQQILQLQTQLLLIIHSASS